jgi:glycosyltransferase involved in cell wall biosynthesis
VTGEGVAPGSVAVLQTTIPDYRERFFVALADRLGARLVVLAGDEDWYFKHAPGVPYVHTRNHFVVRRQLLWQSGAVRQLVRADVAVVGLNPRLLTGWLALALRRLLGRRTVLWGHAWPRHGAASRTDRIRNIMRQLADTVIVYTETEAEQVRSSSRRADVVAAPNALYPERDLVPAEPSDGRTRSIVFVGRLTESKKPGLLLDAFRIAAPELPADVRLTFAGDGPLRAELEARAAGNGLQGRVTFLGHVSSLDELRRLYAGAIASASPGYGGLSVIQSLGFGVPMLIARDEPHAPEIEAAIENHNVVMFEGDRPDVLAMALVDVVGERERWLARRAEISEGIRARYSIETMVDAFVRGLRIDGEAVA